MKSFIKPLDVKEGGITYEGPTLWQSCGDDIPLWYQGKVIAKSLTQIGVTKNSYSYCKQLLLTVATENQTLSIIKRREGYSDKPKAKPILSQQGGLSVGNVLFNK